MANTISKRVADELKRKKLSQQKAADMLGISRSTMRQYAENQSPGAERLIEFRDVLGLDLDAILAPLPSGK